MCWAGGVGEVGEVGEEEVGGDVKLRPELEWLDDEETGLIRCSNYFSHSRPSVLQRAHAFAVEVLPRLLQIPPSI